MLTQYKLNGMIEPDPKSQKIKMTPKHQDTKASYTNYLFGAF